MAALLITYDLHDRSYENDVLTYIKGGDWAMVSSSSYVVLTSKSPDAIASELMALTRNQVTVYVFPVRRPYSGYGQTDVNNWLSQKMPW